MQHLSDALFSLYIAPNLSVRDLGRLAQTGSSLRRLADDNGVWRRLLFDKLSVNILEIVEDSIHRRIWCRTRAAFNRGVGPDCRRRDHYFPETMESTVRNFKLPNYKYFKRAYAKHVRTSPGKIETAKYNLDTQLRLIERAREEIRERQKKAREYKRQIDLYNAIGFVVDQPADTPAHLKKPPKKRRRKK